MPAILNVPSQLRPFVDGKGALELPDGTLDGALHQLDGQFPGLRDRLIDEFGEVRAFINIFVNGDDIIYLQGLLTPVRDGIEIDIVPSIAGGQSLNRYKNQDDER